MHAYRKLTVNQDLWKRQWLNESEYPFVWELTANLRNTEPIARKVSQAIHEALGRLGAPGPEPVWHLVNELPIRPGHIIEAVEILIENGFGPNNLVVLCVSASLASQLRTYTVGPFSFGRWGSRGIPVETIHRFKGLESEAVVVVLGCPEDQQVDIVAYVGMSRARSMLVVTGSKQDQSQIHWLSGSSEVKISTSPC